MIYGYARKSTSKQNIMRQVENILRSYPDARIVEETWTGTSIERPKFQKLVNMVGPNDIIVFDEVSRMSRNEEEGFRQYEELFRKGVELHFLKEPHIDTTTYRKALDSSIQLTGTAVDCILEGVNRYLMELAKEQIKLAFRRSQAETDFLRMRTKEGIQNSHSLKHTVSGHKVGSTYETAKEKECKKIIQKYSVSFGGVLGDDEVRKLCGCSRNSYYKYKSALKRNII